LNEEPVEQAPQVATSPLEILAKAEQCLPRDLLTAECLFHECQSLLLHGHRELWHEFSEILVDQRLPHPG